MDALRVCVRRVEEKLTVVHPDAVVVELIRGQHSVYKRQLEEATGQLTEFNRRFPKGCLTKPADVEVATHVALEEDNDGDGEEEIDINQEDEEEDFGSGQADGDFLDLEFRFNEGDEERNVNA